MEMSVFLGKRARIAALALGGFVASAALGCSSNGDPGQGPTGGDGRYEGTIAVYSATFDDGTGETEYFLRSGSTDEVRLWFGSDPGLEPGARATVYGDRTADGIRVAHVEVDRTLGTAREALINAPPYPERTFAFVLVDIGGGVNLTQADAETRLFGTAPGNGSVKQYYDEVSYGTQPISGAVLGPFTYPMTSCDTRGMATTLRPQVGTYDHYLWYMGSRTSACAWSGLGESGTPSQPQNDTWYNGSASCVVLVQEPGHNFGMQHSSSMTCGTTPFADDPATQCTHNEYGDRYDPMGGGCNHMNGFQKVYEGWLQKCNAVRVGASGTFTIEPVEPECDGIQLLQIPMPKIRPFTRSGGGGQTTTENLQYYYLELRTLQGFDQTIRVAPTVLVHVAEDFPARSDRGRHTWILDMDPSTTRTIDGLGAGQSFTDPAGGVSFDVVSVSADSATVTVTMPGSAAPTCLDGSAYDASAPALCAGLSTGNGAVGGATGTGGTAGTAGAGGTTATGGTTGTGGAGVALPRMEAYTLINADTDTELFLVSDGMYLDLDTLPPNLTLRADPSPSVVGSVAFQLDGAPSRVENIAPYSLSSDNGQGDFAPWTLGLGTHTVTATPYTATNAGGQAGEALTVTFTLGRGPAPDAGAPPPAAGGSLGAGGAPVDSGTGLGAAGPVGVGGVFGAAGTVGAAGAPAVVGGSAFGGAGFGTAGAPYGYPGGFVNGDTGTTSDQPGTCNCRLLGGRDQRERGRGPLALGALAFAVRARRRRARLRRWPPRASDGGSET